MALFSLIHSAFAVVNPSLNVEGLDNSELEDVLAKGVYVTDYDDEGTEVDAWERAIDNIVRPSRTHRVWRSKDRRRNRR